MQLLRIPLDMTLLITKLDKRLMKASKRSGKNFARLRRVDGEPIVCAPPLHVPKWAVDSTFWQSYGDAGSSSIGGSDLGSSSASNSIGLSTEVESAAESDDSDFSVAEI